MKGQLLHDLPGRDFEEALVANRAEVLLILEVHLANVAVQSVGLRKYLRYLIFIRKQITQLETIRLRTLILIISLILMFSPLNSPVRLRENLLALVARIHLLLAAPPVRILLGALSDRPRRRVAVPQRLDRGAALLFLLRLRRSRLF